MAIEERSLLSDLAEVIEEYTHKQVELMRCVRHLRASIYTVTAPAPPEVQTTHPTAELSPTPSNGRPDYDYFADLDRKLAELEAELAEGISVANGAPDSSSSIDGSLPDPSLEAHPTRAADPSGGLWVDWSAPDYTAVDQSGGLWVHWPAASRHAAVDQSGGLWVDRSGPKADAQSLGTGTASRPERLDAEPEHFQDPTRSVSPSPSAAYRGLPPGWYRDESDPALARFWDGSVLGQERRPVAGSARTADRSPLAYRGLPPGWYRDESDPALARFWDGTVLGQERRPVAAPASSQLFAGPHREGLPEELFVPSGAASTPDRPRGSSERPHPIDVHVGMDTRTDSQTFDEPEASSEHTDGGKRVGRVRWLLGR